MSAGGDDRPAIGGPAELLAFAYRLEADAEERYAMLADQMEVHNNPDVAALFRKLAAIEGKHAAEIAERLAGIGAPTPGLFEVEWPGVEGPETVDFGDAHYLMTPWHALKLALKAEQRAFAFFDGVARTAENAEVRAAAEAFAAEEEEHVRLVERELDRHRSPDESWSFDPDPAGSGSAP